MDRRTIVLDLDGVIATGSPEKVYSEEAGWKFEYCTLVPGAVEGLKKLKKKYDLILSTARWESDREKTIKWLEEHGILDLFKEVQVGVKPPALAYIDDRAIRFKDWTSLIHEVDRYGTEYMHFQDGLKLEQAVWVDMFNDKIMTELFEVLWHEHTIKMLGSRVNDFYDFRMGWFYERIDWENEEFFYVYKGSVVVGYFHVWEYKGCKYMAYAVNPKYQGTGIATESFKLLKEELKGRGVKELRANVRGDNVGSAKFLTKSGFVVDSVQNDAYGEGISRFKFRLVL